MNQPEHPDHGDGEPARLIESAPGRWRVAGRLDFDSVPVLAAAGQARLRADRSTQPLEIDLADVQAANSAGLALLLDWLDQARASGRVLTYRHLPDSLRRLAAVSNLGDLLPVAVAAHG